MANITINIAGQAQSYTISDAHAARVLAAYKLRMDPGTTNAQVVKMIADGWAQSLVDFCRSIETDSAVAAARSAVAPIAVTGA